MTREQMEEWTCTRSPVLVLQRRKFQEYCELCPQRGKDGSCLHGEVHQYSCEDAGKQVLGWISERVFADRDQAEAWRAPQKYRFPDEESGRTWRYWAVPAEGSLERYLSEVAQKEQAEACTTNGEGE